MNDGQQQAVLGDQAGRRGFRQGADFAGTLDYLQQPQAADPPVLQAHRQPGLVEQVETPIHALSSVEERGLW